MDRGGNRGRAQRRQPMTTLLRWTGVEKVVSFYRYFAFNGPRVTTASGIVLLLGIATTWLAGGFPVPAYASYFTAYLALLVVGALLAAAGMVAGRRPGLAKVGWALGSLTSAGSLAMYAASRARGLPGLPQLVGRWDYPLGTFAMALAALFLGLHFSVMTGLSIAYPDRRNWCDKPVSGDASPGSPATNFSHSRVSKGNNRGPA